MADKGSIHVETINSENHMILDCSNVDITGNLEVQGDASFNSNVDISSTLNVTRDASFNSNVDVSGDLYVKATSTLSTVNITNSLNVSGDATFNSNVDIRETLSINENKGDVGAVLTSQGTSNPIWERPYFMLAGLNKSYYQNADRSNNWGGGVVVKDMVERFNGTNYNHGHWNETDNCWICPADGFYKITGAITARSNIDNLHELNVIISRYNSNNDFEEDIADSGFDVNDSYTGQFQGADILSANTTTIIYLTESERIKLRVSWMARSYLTVKGSSDSYGSTLTRPEKTYLIVERIIKGTF